MIYVMRYNGASVPDEQKIRKALDLHRIKIVDGSSLPRMAKVEADPATIHNFTSSGEDWSFFPEKTYRVPTTRRSIGK